jgi:malonyl-CoA decarboxylase
VQWLDDMRANTLPASIRQKTETARKVLRGDGKRFSERVATWNPETASPAERKALLALASVYLRVFSPTAAADPVAKFHLGNGARLQRINWAADLSSNAIRQSCGMMVNYLYDLDKVENYHQRFLDGDVVHAQAVARLA